MHRFFSRVIPLAALSLIVTGCGGGTADTTTTPAPTSTTVTDTFSGILTLNGAVTHPFTVTGVGGVSALLTALSPDAVKPVGLSMGTWNGSICQIVLANDVSIQGSVVVGTTSTVGDFCVRIYDANGTVVQPETYIIEVTHQ